MFRRRFDPGSQIFAAQFVEDGGQILYRKSQIGEARAVSQTEREMLVKQFRVRQRWLTAAMVIGMIAAIIAIVAYEDMSASELPEWTMAGLVGVAVAGFFGAFLYFWAEPERYLERRSALAPPLDRPQRRAVAAQMQGYPQMIGWSVLLGFAALEAYDGFAERTTWGVIWFLFLTGCSAVGTYGIVARFVRERF